MPIKAPGYRPVYSRSIHGGVARRNVVAVLSLTAMVDMFTVLTIFLLQNYNPDMAEILDIPEEVILPQAEMSRPIAPAHVVNITGEEISLGRVKLARVQDVRSQESWNIPPLFNEVKRVIADAKREYDNDFRKQLQDAVLGRDNQPVSTEEYRKVTVQADKDVDFAVIKKVMFTITEAGGGEMSFAVLKRKPKDSP